MNFNTQLGFALAFCLALAVGSVGAVEAQDHQPEQSAPLPLEAVQLFTEVFAKIKSEYVDKIDDATLLRNAIRGMLSNLDPHSAFLQPEDFKQITISTEGKFGGLGIEVILEAGLIKVITPIDATPAWYAGIKAGDLIVKLDDEAVRGMSLKQAIDKMRGQPGSEIILTIAREGEPELIEIAVVRAIIKQVSVTGNLLDPGFAYLRLSLFQRNTAQNLRNQIKFLIEKNQAPLQGVVLDLRNNPGGVLASAVEVADLFLSDGDIVSTRGRSATSAQKFSAKPDDIMADAPMVVLVNGGSASASEIVAGALQDHRRAIIMGTRTFGKGSVQTVIPMNNGGALKLTTARYYTPSEKSIQAKGIVPDIIAREAEFSTLPSPDQISEADLSGHLKNDAGVDGDVDADVDVEDAAPDEELDATDAALVASDYQLQEALNLLKGMSLVKLRLENNRPND